MNLGNISKRLLEEQTNKRNHIGTRQIMDTPSNHHPGKDILVVAIWSGLITGLIEAILLYTLQKNQLLSGNIIFLGGGPQIFWLSPIVCLILFGLFGVIFSLISHYKQRLPVFQFSLSIFFWLMFFDWVFIPVSGRVSVYAVMLLAAGMAVQMTRVVNRRRITFIRLSKKITPWALGTLLLIFIGVQGGRWLSEELATSRLSSAPQNAPNILVIVIDTLRADHLSSYGYPRHTSPTIDRLAKQGVVFENAISPSSWTQPAHASLLTGRYPHEHGADNARLDDRFPTIAEELQGLGYRTAAFSANFEVFNKIDGFGRGFIHFEDYYQSFRNFAVNSFYGRFVEYYLLHRLFNMPYRFDRRLAEDINRSALKWVDQDREHPFFVVLNYYDVHAPYIPPQPYRSMFSDKHEPGGRINTDWGMDQIYMGLTPNDIQDEIDSYDGAIAYIDNQIQALVTELDQRGLLDDTAIFILSDHGESFGEHDLLEHHNSLYREIIRVPLIIWMSGVIPKRNRIETPVSLVSLAVTWIDIAGEDGGNVFPNPSLSHFWETSSQSEYWPPPLSESVQVWWVPPQHLSFHGAMKSVYAPELHYINHEKFSEELYAWQTDPREGENLARNPVNQPLINELRQYLGSVFDAQED